MQNQGGVVGGTPRAGESAGATTAPRCSASSAATCNTVGVIGIAVRRHGERGIARRHRLGRGDQPGGRRGCAPATSSCSRCTGPARASTSRRATTSAATSRSSGGRMTSRRSCNATSRGIIVVEAAGNGAENLDDALYQTPGGRLPGRRGRNPFRRANRDSGAIVVGAGAPPPGTHGRDHGPDRSRLDFSNWGALVDAQGWGREVTTLRLRRSAGRHQRGPLVHRHASAARRARRPIVTGVIACIQGMAQGARARRCSRRRRCATACARPARRSRTRPAARRRSASAIVPISAPSQPAPSARARSREGSGEGQGVQGKDKERKEFIKEKEKRKERQGRRTLKELKDKDTKEIKERKEVKEFKEGKEFKEKDKDLVENKRFDDVSGIGPARRRDGEDDTQQRLAALEQTVQQLVHFIGAELRPDLSQSALQGEQRGGQGREGPEGRREAVGVLSSEGPRADCEALRPFARAAAMIVILCHPGDAAALWLGASMRQLASRGRARHRRATRVQPSHRLSDERRRRLGQRRTGRRTDACVRRRSAASSIASRYLPTQHFERAQPRGTRLRRIRVQCVSCWRGSMAWRAASSTRRCRSTLGGGTFPRTDTPAPRGHGGLADGGLARQRG